MKRPIFFAFAFAFASLSSVACNQEAPESSTISSNAIESRSQSEDAEKADIKIVQDEGVVSIAAYAPMEIKHRGTGKCLDVKGGAGHNGADVIMWDCNGQRNQEWSREDVGNNHFRLKSRSSGKCLDFAGGNGGKVVIWDCHGGGNQRFAWYQGNDKSYAFLSTNGSTCLDYTRFGTMVHWQCHNGHQQQFTVRNKI